MNNTKAALIGLIVTTLYATTLHAAPSSPDPTLAEAAKEGSASKVISLLEKKVEVNAALADGTTALHWATYHEDLPLTEKLLKAGADPNAGSRVAAIPPLFLSVTNGNAAITKALLKAGANVNAKSANGTTALMIAAASGNKETVDALIDAGADKNARENIYGQTALMFAAAKNRATVIRVLINRGADPALTSNVSIIGRPTVDEDGNPLPQRGAAAGTDAAAPTGDTGGRSGDNRRRGAAAAPGTYGTEDSARPSREPGTEEGSNSARRQRCGAPTEAGAAGTQRQRTDEDGNPLPPPTGRAGASGPTQRTFGGNSALTLAAREGNIAAVRALIESHVDINEPNAGDKSTPIVTAISNGHYDVAKYLLDHGADPNKASVDGLTALYAVIDTQWAPVGWAPNPITDQEKITYLELMKAILDHKADVNARLTRRLWFRPTHHQEGWINTAGSTAFWRAAQATDLAAMRLLITHGADPKIATDEGVNALMVAAGLGWNGNYSVQGPDSALDTVKYCLELGLDPTPQSTQGYTALAGAAYRGDNELVKLLVSKGARLDVRTTRGWSVTDMANGPSLRSSVPVKHPETVIMLLLYGAPELTEVDNEEILGIIRTRPAQAVVTPENKETPRNKETKAEAKQETTQEPKQETP